MYQFDFEELIYSEKINKISNKLNALKKSQISKINKKHKKEVVKCIFKSSILQFFNFTFRK